jgi:hypothetical protein
MLPKSCPVGFTKSYPTDLTHVHVVGLDKRRRIDDSEARGKHHSSVPIHRGEAPEPYVSGSTTTHGSTADAAVDDGITDDAARNQYPRRRRKPRDNQSVGKQLAVGKKNARADIGKQQPTAINVTGVGIMLLPRVIGALVAAGLHLKVRGPGQFSLSRKDAPAALIALRRAKFSPEVMP